MGGMKKILLIIIGLALLACLIVLGLRPDEQNVRPAAAPVPTPLPAPSAVTPTAAAKESYQGFLYGRIATANGVTYEGRLRWGVGDQEAFWGDYFNGAKDGNPWAVHVPVNRLPKERRPFEIFGIEIFQRERPIDL